EEQFGTIEKTKSDLFDFDLGLGEDNNDRVKQTLIANYFFREISTASIAKHKFLLQSKFMLNAPIWKRLYDAQKQVSVFANGGLKEVHAGSTTADGHSED